MTERRTRMGIGSLPPGTSVEIIDGTRLPAIRTYVGRKGVIERPEEDGCYVRFSDHSYVFTFWDELRRLPPGDQP